MIGEDGPGVVNESEGMRRESEGVAIRVKEESETAILRSDVLDAVSVREDLEDTVPVLEIIDAIFAGEEGVDDGEEELGGVECGIGFASTHGEGTSAVEITCAEKLIGGVEPPFGFGSAATIVHFHEPEREKRV